MQGSVLPTALSVWRWWGGERKEEKEVEEEEEEEAMGNQEHLFGYYMNEK